MNQNFTSSPPPPLGTGDFTFQSNEFTLSHYTSIVAVTCSVVSVFVLMNVVLIKEYLKKRNLTDSNV